MAKVRFTLVTTASALLLCSLALAQDSRSKLQVFAGYSLVYGDSGGLNAQTLDSGLGEPTSTFGVTSNFNGWNFEAQYNMKSSFGLVADVAGRYGAPITASSGSGISNLPNSDAYSFMLGPVFSFKAGKKITPFVHALFGVDRWILNGTTISGLPATEPTNTAAVTDTNFAFAAGGGVDYKLLPRVSVRVAQVDYFHTVHDLNVIYGEAFGPGRFTSLPTSEDNLRFSAGIVLKF